MVWGIARDRTNDRCDLTTSYERKEGGAVESTAPILSARAGGGAGIYYLAAGWADLQ